MVGLKGTIVRAQNSCHFLRIFGSIYVRKFVAYLPGPIAKHKVKDILVASIVLLSNHLLSGIVRDICIVKWTARGMNLKANPRMALEWRTTNDPAHVAS